jgi:hypothetical protein
MFLRGAYAALLEMLLGPCADRIILSICGKNSTKVRLCP